MIRILVGDALTRLRELPDNSVHCVCTSPPYWGLRDYGTGQWEGGEAGCDHVERTARNDVSEAELARRAAAYGTGTQDGSKVSPIQYRDACAKCGARRVDQQIGLEESPDLYVARLVEVFREVRRVLRPDGVLWLNLGDGYTDKQLLMMPARVALALQTDGWWLRSEIVWCKSAPMPESVTDRPTSATEKIFLLTKSPRYYYDAEAVKEESVSNHASGNGFKRDARLSYLDDNGPRGNDEQWQPTAGRNQRNFWLLGPEPFPEAHFATFPTEIPRRAISAGCSERGCCSKCGAPWERVTETNNPSKYTADNDTRNWANTHSKTSNAQSSKSLHRNGGGVYSTATTTGWRAACACDADIRPCTVLDPFAGSGTTLMVADRLGRDAIGIELNSTYAEMAVNRIRNDAGMFADIRVEKGA